MSNYSCPGCGADIQFRSRFSTHTVCRFCQSFLIRERDLLFSKGKIASLAEDLSVLQIGTQGKIDNVPFEIIGLLKAYWKQGFWNEWYVIEENGASAWLSEAMGHFSYCQQSTQVILNESPWQYKLNQTVLIEHKPYYICDIKKFTCGGFVGELPFSAIQQEEGVCIDLRTEDDSCAFFEYLPSGSRAFVGKYVSFEQFGFTHLRELNDW